MYKTKEKGFTLIELLVVIAIIGILAGTLFVAINPADQAKKARDAKRLAMFKEIQKALDLYILDHGYYPKLQKVTTSGSGANLDVFQDELSNYLKLNLYDEIWNNNSVFHYKSSSGNKYQGYGIFTILESSTNNNLEEYDGGFHGGWYEIGPNVIYCMNKYTGDNRRWWEDDSNVCKGGN